MEKFLANRLHAVLPYLINELQMAFVGYMNLLDDVVIANGIIAHWKKEKNCCLLAERGFRRSVWHFEVIIWSILYKRGFLDI